MPARHVVGTVAEIPPGGRKLVEIEGRSIGVFNLKGEFYALRNRCAHQGGPLCKGRLTGFLQSRGPGDYTYTRQGEILRCPWHGWEFDVKHRPVLVGPGPHPRPQLRRGGGGGRGGGRPAQGSVRGRDLPGLGGGAVRGGGASVSP